MRVAALVLALVFTVSATLPALAMCGGHVEQTAQSKAQPKTGEAAAE